MISKIIICPKCEGDSEECNICDDHQGIIEFPVTVEIVGSNIFNNEASYSNETVIESDS